MWGFFLFSFAKYPAACRGDGGEENNPSEARRRRAKEGIRLRKNSARYRAALLRGASFAIFPRIGVIFQQSMFNDIGKRYIKYYVKNKILIVFSVFNYFLSKKELPEKRILGIWDIKSGLALGVLIEFLTRLLCQAELKNIKKIDIAFIYDSESPITNPKFSQYINASNLHYHLAEIIPILNTAPKLGSVLFFDSHSNFEYFLAENGVRYHTEPSFSEYLKGVTAIERNFAVIRDFYLEKKFVPQLEFKQTTIKWARAFIKKYTGDKLMVSINLRFNSQFTPDRNADLEVWSNLFKYANDKYPNIAFIILGRKGELGDRFKNFPNIIFSKDFNTNVEQDLALIHCAFFHMGTTSGLASLAYYGNTPCVLTNFRARDTITNLLFKPESVFPWHNKKLKRLICDKENSELLIKEFENLLEKVDKTEWRKRLNLEEVNSNILEWPYIEK